MDNPTQGRGRGSDGQRGRGGRGRGRGRGRGLSDTHPERAIPSPVVPAAAFAAPPTAPPEPPLRTAGEAPASDKPAPQPSEKPKRKAKPRKQTPEEGSGLARTEDKTEAAAAKLEALSLSDSRLVAGAQMSQGDVSEAIEVVYKPDSYGRDGKPIMLIANVFQLTSYHTNDVYQYDVVMSPSMTNKRNNRIVMQSIISSNTNHFPVPNGCVYDGIKNVYSNKRLPIPDAGCEVKASVVLDPQLPPKEFRVQIKLASCIHMSLLDQFMRGQLEDIPQDQLRVLDTVMHHSHAITNVVVGRRMFPLNQRDVDLGGGYSMWVGRYVSVRPSWKMLVNVDVSAAAFYKSQSLLDFWEQFLRIELRELNPYEKRKLSKELKGLKVQMEIKDKNVKRCQRVVGLVDAANKQKFTMEGRSLTVAQYFQEHYNLKLKMPFLPCLHVGSKDRTVYLPMELCSIVAGQKVQGKLSDFHTSRMIRETAKPAPERLEKICNLVKQMHLHNDPYLKSYSICMNEQPMPVKGRVLPPPSIVYQGEQQVVPRNGVWDMQNNQFINGAHLRKWAAVSFHFRVGRDTLQHFCRKLQDTGTRLGMKFESSAILLDRPQARFLDLAQIDAFFRKLRTAHPDLSMVVVVLQGNEYGDIKRVCDLVLRIVTQCVQEKNVSRLSEATLRNICLKMNSKLGGSNNTVFVKVPDLKVRQAGLSDGRLDRTSRTQVLSAPIMILGADVNHPSPGENTKPSVAAVVASLNRNLNVYAAEVRIQPRRKEKIQEVISELQQMVKQLLLKFYNFNRGMKPQRIVMFRDGVSEGQYNQVLRQEMEALQACCMSLENTYRPGITFVVVQKRHHTRLFPWDAREGVGRSGNIPPGTVVDNEIVHPLQFDYFLCSHQGIQGTSRPTHYFVLYDDNDFSSDAIQKLTYYMCHVYARCTRSVSIPAPTYYAHLAAFRARYHMVDSADSSSDSSTAGPVSPETADRLPEKVPDTMYFV